MAILWFVIGLAAGVLAGLFGVGGGIIIVPALVILAKFSVRQATGTSLAALLLPVGAFGVWEYYRRDFVHFPAAGLIALGLFLGAWFGTRIGFAFSTTTLQKVFAVFLVFVAFHLWRTA